jgi:hypothetical protein
VASKLFDISIIIIILLGLKVKSPPHLMVDMRMWSTPGETSGGGIFTLYGGENNFWAPRGEQESIREKLRRWRSSAGRAVPMPDDVYC